ncbi:protein fantom-like [Glandiceps talaboti]
MPGPPYITDETAYDLPVRDTPSKYGGGYDDEGIDGEHKQGQQRRAISKLGRDELEDKYLRLYEENLVLKKHARKQEDKIKRMATKLLRLVNDKKKAHHLDVGGKVRDVETEEMLEDMHGKIRELEKQNEQLKNKLMVTKQQLVTQGKRNDPYTYVHSRVDTGRGPKPPPQSDRLKKGLRVQGEGAKSATPRAFRNDVLPRYGHSLLEEARAENKQLDDYIRQLQDQIQIMEHDTDMMKEQMDVRNREHDDELLRLREQMSAGQRSNIQENVELIRLQRELKEKSTKLTGMEAQYQSLEDNLRTVKGSHDAVLIEMDKLNRQLQMEQNRSMGLQSELKSGTITQRQLIEFQERIADLDREKEILKEANEKLLNSAFDAERERQYRANDKQLKLQIAQLEATLKGDLNDKNTILDKLTDERDTREKLEKEHREIQIRYYSTKQQLDELQEKMKFFTKESAVDFQELEEALILVKKRKEKGSQELEFLEKVDEELNKDLKQQIVGLQAEHAETVEELEKTRNMLILQHKINRDYQQEVESATQRLEDYKKEYDTKLEEYAQLLDIRAARIKKLEHQLRDVAYGTKQIKMKDFIDEHDDQYDEIDESIKLERGQNVFEIHVKQINYSREALKEMGDNEPSSFVTYEFFEFEVQSTPVVKGDKPGFEFTSQYIVTVDDFFLHHLMKESTTLEIHQALGTEYKTVAACQLKFRDLLEKPHGRLHGTGQLTGVDGRHIGTNFGIVEYWVRLRVPMDQALRLFRERIKALGYMTANSKATQEALKALETQEDVSRRDKSMNELVMKIVRAKNVQARRTDVQPSPYCVYRFFDFNDHDTVIIPNSNNPEFNDSKLYPVPVNVDLDRYLRTESISVYVFDDTDPEETAYLGVAKVPLISLAHDKAIKGTFDLKMSTGESNGTIDIQLKWQYSYMPPKAGPAPAPAATKPEKEAIAAATTPIKSAIRKPAMQTPVKGHVKVDPVATSTPLAVPADKPVREQRRRKVLEPELKKERESRHAEPRSLTQQSISESTMHVATPTIEETNSEMSSAPEDRRTDSDDDTITEQEPKPGEDTMFEEERNDYDEDDDIDGETDTSIQEEVDVPVGTGDTEDGQDTGDEIRTDEELESQDDSESVVMTPAANRPASTIANENVVTVTIFSLVLDEDSSVMQDNKIERLYVEYRFLGVEPQELETPFSLPKPKQNQAIYFNFKKLFHIDPDNNKLRRDYLASMLLPEDPTEGKIRFTVVSEPPEDHQSLDCEDVGYAYVDVKQILQDGKDVIEQDIDVYDADDDAIIGTLNVTTECLAALQAVEKELPAPGDVIE